MLCKCADKDVIKQSLCSYEQADMCMYVYENVKNLHLAYWTWNLKSYGLWYRAYSFNKQLKMTYGATYEQNIMMYNNI